MTSHDAYVALSDIRMILVCAMCSLLALGVMIVHYLDGIRDELRDARDDRERASRHDHRP